MAIFDMMDDDDFEGIFLTQMSGTNKLVSLEEECDYKTVHDPKYSDISDDEEKQTEMNLRFVI